MNPEANPNAGEATSASITTPTVPQPTASNPSATTAAPTSPPMSACVELDGSPRHHERTFQTSAPLTPAPTTATTWSAGTSTTLATVSATAAPRTNGPSSVKSAATRRAAPGAAERVATRVATASAASCTPLVKLNAVATMIAARSPPATAGIVPGFGGPARQEVAGAGMVRLRLTRNRPLYRPCFGVLVG